MSAVTLGEEVKYQFNSASKLPPFANDQSLWLIPSSSSQLTWFLSFGTKFSGFIVDCNLKLITSLSLNVLLYGIYQTENVEDFKSDKTAFNNNQHILLITVNAHF